MTTADTTLRFYGYWHLAGSSVAVSIAGLDCGDFTVSTDGSVTVPYSANTLLNPTYLEDLANVEGLSSADQCITFDVYDGTAIVSVKVPVVIGLSYTTQGQRVRPDAAEDLRSPFGPGLGKTKRTHMYGMLVKDATSGAISVGTDFTTLYAMRITTDGQNELVEDNPYTGVYWDTLTDLYGFDNMLCWQVTRPYSCNICSVTSFLKVSER